MGFKKITYGSEGRLKIKIEDANGACEGNWTIMMSDLFQWAEIMRKKYGIKHGTDLDWAKGDMY